MNQALKIQTKMRLKQGEKCIGEHIDFEVFCEGMSHSAAVNEFRIALKKFKADAPDFTVGYILTWELGKIRDQQITDKQEKEMNQ